jgi:hypothetical protein
LATDIFVQLGYALCHHMEQQENEAQSFRFRRKFGRKDGILVEKFKDIEVIKNFSKLMIFETDLIRINLQILGQMKFEKNG